MTLRLLLNLSFDPALRLEIVRGALLPGLTALLGLIELKLPLLPQHDWLCVCR